MDLGVYGFAFMLALLAFRAYRNPPPMKRRP
jgi:hypothetical protein